MGKINILNDAGTNKLTLEFNGTSDSTINSAGLVNHDLVTVDSDGNVGIGTSSPSSLLQVNGGSGDIYPISTIDSSSNIGLELGQYGTVGNISGKSGLDFEIDKVLKMRIDSSGNIIQNGATQRGLINIQTPGSHEYFFDKELDSRSVCDGTYSGYLLLVPAYTSGTVSGKKFYGTIVADRGSTGSGNSTSWGKVLASTAYNSDTLKLQLIGSSQFMTDTYKVTYGGVRYLALGFSQTGGGPDRGFYAEGHVMGEDSNFLFMARHTEVTDVVQFGTRLLEL